MHKPEIDIALTALCLHSQPGQTLSCEDIAEVCGCATNNIYEVQKRAMDKLRKKAHDFNLYDFIDPSLESL